MFEADIATLFPEMCDAVLNCSILKRAKNLNLVDIKTHNIRHFSTDKHKKVDDYPYGGGKGMLMQANPIFRCYENTLKERKKEMHVIHLSPQGKILTQKKVLALSKFSKPLFLVCGHYEGIDQRIIDKIVDEEISIGDYVLTGGELGALVLLDAIVRLIPGVLTDKECYEEESIFNGLLEHPQYTRPRVWEGMQVPEVLLSGHHEKIKNWKKEKSIEVTKIKRPDLFSKLTSFERKK